MSPIKTFLATTALEEFWDTSQSILFLGEWCQRPDKKNAAKNVNAEILKSDQLSSSRDFSAYQQSINTYEALLPLIANWLNEVHQLSYSLRYWRITLGPFLLWYIQVVYHRWFYLKIAYCLYPDLQTIGLATTSYITPINSREFIFFSSESDAWNLQLFTQLLCIAFKTPELLKDFSFTEEREQRQRFFGKNSHYKKLTKLKLQFVKYIAKRRGSRVVGVCCPMFERNFIYKLSFLSKLQILPLTAMEYVDQAVFDKQMINLTLRDQLTTMSTKDELSNIVLKTLKFNLPMNFIECYKETVAQSKTCYPYHPRVIVGASWLGDDLVKFWGAEKAETGTRLIDIQHGGGYGAGKYSSYEYLGRRNCDAFISWGWKADDKVIPASSTLICQRYGEHDWKKRPAKKADLILWTMTESSRYLSYFESALESMCQSYFEWQQQFAAQINPAIFSQIVLRLRPASKYVDYFQTRFPTLNIHLPKDRISFFKQLYRTKILISDNLGTVFHYALAFNIPTILFWDKNYFEIREEAMIYFKKLQEAGIYHDSPQSAANMLNTIADNPDAWWQSEKVQEIRKEFCDQFASFSSSWVSEWRDLLLAF